MSPEIKNRGTSGPKIGHVNVSNLNFFQLKKKPGTTQLPTRRSQVDRLDGLNNKYHIDLDNVINLA